MSRRFSERTMAECCSIIHNVMTDAQLDNFFTKFGLQQIYRRLPTGSAKLKRIQEVVAYLSRPGAMKDTDDLWDRLILEIIEILYGKIGDKKSSWSNIEDALRADGYEIENGKVVLSLPQSGEVKQIYDKIEKKLGKMGLGVPLRHLEQARENYNLQLWESANASIRSFLEAVFNEIAEKLPTYPQNGIDQGGKRRQFLAEVNFISKDESELLKHLFKILHTSGSHPGISNESDCSSRILMSVGIAWRVLSRVK
ncbi:MAG: hypothetical protein AB1538_13095 [Bacillota bacterium]